MYAAWRKSSRSTGDSNCIEVADSLTTVGIRDTKDRSGPVVTVTRASWRAFVSAVKAGDLS